MPPVVPVSHLRSQPEGLNTHVPVRRPRPLAPAPPSHSILFYFFLSLHFLLQLSIVPAGTLGVNSCNVDGFSPLHVAALHGHSGLVALLVRHGANVNGRNNHSATPLHLASQNSHVKVNQLVVCWFLTNMDGIHPVL